MLKNGRAYTVENGSVDDGLVTDFNTYRISEIGEWIRKNIRKSKTILHGYTSYGLKHMLEEDTGIYMTNNQFKDAMLLAGFEAVDVKELNWKFKITLVREINHNPSPFFKWAMKFDGVNSPEGDFANDMKNDFTFPVFADHEIIQDYLDRLGACDAARNVFEDLWTAYERENG